MGEDWRSFFVRACIVETVREQSHSKAYGDTERQNAHLSVLPEMLEAVPQMGNRDSESRSPMKKRPMAKHGWRPISTAPKDSSIVDLWVAWGAFPSTMGIADAFRVTDAWWDNGRWVHLFKGEKRELVKEYITHWMPVPKPPRQVL